MEDGLSKRTRIRCLLTLLIVITLPCYILGIILLRLDRGPVVGTPTPTITLTGTITPTATITLTPYLSGRRPSPHPFPDSHANSYFYGYADAHQY